VAAAEKKKKKRKRGKAESCQGCHVKRAHYGLLAEGKKRRWCGGCAAGHAGAVNMNTMKPVGVKKEPQGETETVKEKEQRQRAARAAKVATPAAAAAAAAAVTEEEYVVEALLDKRVIDGEAAGGSILSSGPTPFSFTENPYRDRK
jgi:hypothetical protein